VAALLSSVESNADVIAFPCCDRDQSPHVRTFRETFLNWPAMAPMQRCPTKKYPHPSPPQALRREDARSSSARIRMRKGARIRRARIRRSHPQAVIQQACAKYCGSRHCQSFSLHREKIGSYGTERETVGIRILSPRLQFCASALETYWIGEQ